MIKDKFKFSKLNLILMGLDIFLVIFVIIIGISLIRSFSDSSDTIPNLRTTVGKRSTNAADLTKTTTEEVISTTKNQENENSPYYNLDVEELFNNELYSNGSSTLSKDNQIEIIKGFFKILCALYDVTDDDIINTSYLLNHVKSGEYDSITIDNYKYGIVYNGDALMKRLFYTYSSNERHDTLTLNNIKVLTYTNNNFYKLENTIGNKNFVVSSYELESAMSNNEIHGKVIYYDANYKEKGKTKITYESILITLKFDSSNNAWKIENFNFPGLEE